MVEFYAFLEVGVLFYIFKWGDERLEDLRGRRAYGRSGSAGFGFSVFLEFFFFLGAAEEVGERGVGDVRSRSSD